MTRGASRARTPRGSRAPYMARGGPQPPGKPASGFPEPPAGAAGREGAGEKLSRPQSAESGEQRLRNTAPVPWGAAPQERLARPALVAGLARRKAPQGRSRRQPVKRGMRGHARRARRGGTERKARLREPTREPPRAYDGPQATTQQPCQGWALAHLLRPLTRLLQCRRGLARFAIGGGGETACLFRAA